MTHHYREIDNKLGQYTMKFLNKYWSHFVRWFDRSFSYGWVRQVAFLLATLAVLIAIWTIGMSFYHEKPADGESKSSFVRTLELMLDPGAFQGSDNGEFPIIIQLLVTLTGAVFFTAMLITVLSNILSNRIEKIKKGRVQYSFEDHIIILGANHLLNNLLKEFATTKIHNNRRVVIITSQDIEDIYSTTLSSIQDLDKIIDITWINGAQTVENVLLNADIDKAHSIYILGESDEANNDSVNLETWNLVRKVCKNILHEIDCYLVVERMATYHILQFDTATSDSHLHLNIINSLENWAHRVLVTREYQEAKYPAIDRCGISINDNHTVRFVIYGINRMSYAMASTVAHIAHFPNFIKDRRKRTKICLAAPEIKKEMDFFLGHYDNLFKLAHAKLVYWDNNNEIHEQILRTPEPEDDFLDIEWEFWDTSIESENMRNHISRLSTIEDEYLSLAICDSKSDSSAAAALYLPDEIYQNNVPVFVYQTSNGEVLRYAHNVAKYSNIYPFGMYDEYNDTFLRSRINKAKKINYLYELENNGHYFDSMPSQNELDKLWHKITAYVLKLSNIYSANSIPTKLRSIGIDPDNMPEDQSLTQEQINILSEIEHNRWNMERLLLGIQSLPFAERTRINQLILSDDPDQKSMGKKLKQEYQAKYFHKDIAAYEELPEYSKKYDEVIVSNIPHVLR